MDWCGSVISDSKQFVDKKLCVWGAGVEGQAMLRHLRTKVGIQGQILVLDEACDASRQSALRKSYGPLHFEHDPSLVNCQILLRSPGVSPYGKAWHALLKNQAPPDLSSNTVLWLGDATRCAHTIAVTGSKGKTTCTTLLGKALNALGVGAVTGGNSTDTSLIDMPDAPIYVAEISSFQAVEINKDLRPAVTLLSNLYNAHTDWHGSHERYMSDKLKLCVERNDSLTVCNARDPGTLQHLGNAKHVIWYGDERGMHIRDECCYYHDEVLGRLDHAQFRAPHAADNVCGVLEVIAQLGKCMDVPKPLHDINWDEIFIALNTFSGLRHRQEYIGSYHGHHYIDDGAATIPEATLGALQACHARYGEALTLLLGGQEHTQNYALLAQVLRRMPQIRIVLLPDNGATLAQLIKSIDESIDDSQIPMPALFIADNLRDGMRWAKQHTPNGGLILLSPAAPSMGQFANYVERSTLFKQLAQER